MAGIDASTESGRLQLLELCRDPGTQRRLAGLGVDRGWRCLEVGAGRGSVARWLGDRVGPLGTVVAVDVDPRFLVDLPANVEVRVRDISDGDLGLDGYDIVHFRALLTHLPNRDSVLSELVAALRPGGLLLAEEGDYGLCHLGGHPDAEALNAIVRRALDGMARAGLFDPNFGRYLPGMLVAAGLELGGGEVETPVAVPGDPEHAQLRANWEVIGPGLVAAGLLDETELRRLVSFFDRPGTVITGGSLVCAWGRKTASASDR